MCPLRRPPKGVDTLTWRLLSALVRCHPSRCFFPQTALLDLSQRAAGEDGAIELWAVNVPRRISVFIAVLDEQPALPIARPSQPPSGLDHGKASAQLFALERHVDFASGKLLVRRDVRFRLVCALVPDHHRSRAIQTFRNHTLEVGIFQRMVLCPDSQPLICRVHGRPFRNRPRYQDSVDRQPEIIVQAAGVVFLNDKDTPADPTPDASYRLRSFSEFPLPAVLFEWHSVSRVSAADSNILSLDNHRQLSRTTSSGLLSSRKP